MSNKIMLIIGIIALLFMLVVGAGFYMMWSKMSSLAVQTNAETEELEIPEDEPETLGAIYSLDTFIVNLADKEGKRYLRITLDLEYNDENLDEELEKRLPQIRDSILMIIPDKKYHEINTADGKKGLRDELMAVINGLLKTGQIINIYFSEFVIQ